MRLKSFEIIGLFGPDKPSISGEFSDDINIITGRNGSGKTTVMKLIWYVISGNILLALNEVTFSKVTIETDLYTCALTRLSKATCKVEMIVDGQIAVYEDVRDDDDDIVINAEDIANSRLIELGSSVFFPTFRRLEGGFTSTTTRAPSFGINNRKNSDIEESLVSLSRKLTNGSHIFVSAISTVDIVSLLLRQYADLSETSNSLQQSTSQDIIETIKHFRSEKEDLDDSEVDEANRVIDAIRAKIEGMERQRELLFSPIETVTALVKRLFQHNGINFGPRLSIGDAAGAVSSDALSAGEKQMLSFICYNTFYSNCVFFIDEPELSLHVDWQRQMFPLLMRQQSSNQFVIATHSPFIYGKYPDKEIVINSDRGDQDFE